MIKSFTELEKIAKERPSRRIALAMAQEADALRAVLHAAKENVVEPILIGDESMIKQIAEQEGLDISNCPVMHVPGDAETAERAVELVKTGEADLLMKGRVYTAAMMKAVLNKERGIRNSDLLSYITIMEIPRYHKLLLMTDAALNIDPDLETKIGLIKNALTVTRKLGIEKAKVAALGAVEKVNADMPETIDAAILSKMADRGQITDCTIDGPFALDNAVSEKSCRIKGIKTEVGGDADILLMPDIDSANIFYKTIAYLTDYKMGSFVIGAKVPIIVTSRSDSDMIKYLSILAGVTLS